MAQEEDSPQIVESRWCEVSRGYAATKEDDMNNAERVKVGRRSMAVELLAVPALTEAGRRVANLS